MAGIDGGQMLDLMERTQVHQLVLSTPLDVITLQDIALTTLVRSNVDGVHTLHFDTNALSL